MDLAQIHMGVLKMRRSMAPTARGRAADQRCLRWPRRSARFFALLVMAYLVCMVAFYSLSPSLKLDVLGGRRKPGTVVHAPAAAAAEAPARSAAPAHEGGQAVARAGASSAPVLPPMPPGMAPSAFPLRPVVPITRESLPYLGQLELDDLLVHIREHEGNAGAGTAQGGSGWAAGIRAGQRGRQVGGASRADRVLVPSSAADGGAPRLRRSPVRPRPPSVRRRRLDRLPAPPRAQSSACPAATTPTSATATTRRSARRSRARAGRVRTACRPRSLASTAPNPSRPSSRRSRRSWRRCARARASSSRRCSTRTRRRSRSGRASCSSCCSPSARSRASARPPTRTSRSSSPTPPT